MTKSNVIKDVFLRHLRIQSRILKQRFRDLPDRARPTQLRLSRLVYTG